MNGCHEYKVKEEKLIISPSANNKHIFYTNSGLIS